MNLADPELELIDPTPNVHALFLQFDKIFFWTKLASRAVVRWSKRMYSCAGVCSYDRGGLCDIALSEPLLKLRPRKDLIETLLHEMIHAFLFITKRDQDRDGHGPNFKEHMFRINHAAGLNISIYHSFHDEVAVYQTHWWRCDGPCQTRKPYFGIVRRSSNRAPGPSDYWWLSHQKTCGGAFIKIKEPEKKTKKSTAENKAKKNGDITKYVNKNTNETDEVRKPLTPVAKNVTTPVGIKTKSNGGNTVVITKKTTTESPITKPPSPQKPLVFTGKGQTVSGGRKSATSSDVAEVVRNIWANKQLSVLSITPVAVKRKSTSGSNIHDRTSNSKGTNSKIETANSNSPPAKIKKIDDYFKTAATSILKDIYGTDFRLTQTNNKIVAMASKKTDLVDCPICSKKVDDSEINRHLDECLNKDVIKKLSEDNIEINATESNNKPNSSSQSTTPNLKEIIGKLPTIPTLEKKKVKEENSDVKPIVCANVTVDLTNINNNNRIIKNENNKRKSNFDSKTEHMNRKSENFVVVKEEPTATAVKIEAGASKDTATFTEQKCACCGSKINKPMAEHLDECLSFFDNNTTIPEEGTSSSFGNSTIVIDDDDDDIFDETLTLNATGTKTPCPCCLEMIEMNDMNAHLDTCLT